MYQIICFVNDVSIIRDKGEPERIIKDFGEMHPSVSHCLKQTMQERGMDDVQTSAASKYEDAIYAYTGFEHSVLVGTWR